MSLAWEKLLSVSNLGRRGVQDSVVREVADRVSEDFRVNFLNRLCKNRGLRRLRGGV